MRGFLLIAFLFFLSGTWLCAQNLRVVSGVFTYNLSQNISPEHAKRQAVEKAKYQLIADEFGTIIGSSNSIVVKNTTETSDVRMMTFGESEVKGEWIETIGEPEVSLSFERDMIVVTVGIKGRVREIKGAQTEIEARILRNGLDKKFESAEFRSGDSMYLYFRTPVSGYLAVYLFDGDDSVYCLLPYGTQPDGIVKVKANTSYVFFSTKENASGIPVDFIDEYQLTCAGDVEFNRMYVVFSKNPFMKTLDNDAGSGLPRMLEWEAFNRWIAKCRKHDEDMVLVVRDMMIYN